ncbi:MAG: site-specific DNA-methyltransferase, partial [Methanobacteriota archaeon]
TGQVDDEGKKFSTNTETTGRFHSRWLNMMYPRLYLARNLLREDGVIFISIDENELINLQHVCNHIFGEENVLGNFPVIMNLKGNQDAFGFAETHEYIIVCAKSKSDCKLNYFPVDEEAILAEWLEDEYGLYKEADNLRATGVNAPREKRPNLWYPIFLDEDTKEFYITENDQPLDPSHIEILPINPEGQELSWYWSKNKFVNNKHNLILKKTSNGWQLYKKQRPSLGDVPTRKPKSFFYKPEYSTSTATTRLKELLGAKVFDGPKPVPFISDLITIGADNDSIILDFFAGSGTTAQAVMELNALDNGKRRFISVQLPERTVEQSNAFSAGYKTIADIGKERIRRVIRKIEQEREGELALRDKKPDLGFRVFKLDRSNFKVWNGELADADEVALQRQLEMHVEHVSEDSSQEDILYELLLKAGFPLTTKVEAIEMAGKQVFSIEDGAMLICLEDEVTPELIDAMAEADPLQVICLDRAFAGN